MSDAERDARLPGGGMNWKKDVPTEPGWYFWKPSKRSLEYAWNPVRVFRYDGNTRFGRIGEPSTRAAPYFGGWWLGPVGGANDTRH